MKKKPLAPHRPQEAMARFDRLLAAMAPKPEAPPKKALTPRGTKKRTPAKVEAARKKED